jgi:uncharacterized protein YjbJ (UPF0337 family)
MNEGPTYRREQQYLSHPSCRRHRKQKGTPMTEGFRPPVPARPGWGDTAASRHQEVQDTVQRIFDTDIAPPSSATDGSTAEVAKQQTAQVADTAKQAGTQVAGTVKEQAGQVTGEAKNQAKQLLSQAQSELSEQAASTQQRVSAGLHTLADELSGMADNSEQDGVATDLARQAADRARSAASWLGDRDPGSLLNEVRSFARRKPGTYLAIALGAGVLAGRLTRGLSAPTDETPSSSSGVVAASPGNQVGTGRHGLTATNSPSGAAALDPTPALDPAPAPHSLGNGGNALGGRGRLAP